MKKPYALIACIAFATSMAANAQSQDRKDLMTGTSVPVTAGQRTIVITPDTKSIRVQENEVVKFVAGSVEFAWRFNGQSSRPFNLQEVAPQGALANPVTVFVQSNPSFR